MCEGKRKKKKMQCFILHDRHMPDDFILSSTCSSLSYAKWGHVHIHIHVYVYTHTRTHVYVCIHIYAHLRRILHSSLGYKKGTKIY